MARLLTSDDFQSRATVRLARRLIGKTLARRQGKKLVKVFITETEAYHGFDDRASHAARGKTKRNTLMWGKAGYWYVYFVYGNHWMLNLVTGPEKYPAAILIRGIETEEGRRINGPGRLTKFLRINGSFNGMKVDRKTGLWIEDEGIKISPREIRALPRVGIDYAGEEWAGKKWRFVLE